MIFRVLGILGKGCISCRFNLFADADQPCDEYGMNERRI